MSIAYFWHLLYEKGLVPSMSRSSNPLSSPFDPCLWFLPVVNFCVFVFFDEFFFSRKCLCCLFNNMNSYDEHCFLSDTSCMRSAPLFWEVLFAEQSKQMSELSNFNLPLHLIWFAIKIPSALNLISYQNYLCIWQSLYAFIFLNENNTMNMHDLCFYGQMRIVQITFLSISEAWCKDVWAGAKFGGPLYVRN